MYKRQGLDVKKEDIGKRVSAIDDPLCDEHDSYGSHMSSLLLDGLDELGIKYLHKTAHDTYKNGLLKDQIHRILVDSKKIGDKIEELTGQQKFQNVLPYFPVCKNCDRLYTTESFEYIADEKKIRYRCKDSEIGSNVIKGCGHEGESDFTKDLGKLAWKVEFAARWQAFDIRFEAYGKDIMDSVKVNDWVSDEILNFPHPHHIKYEMFLDKGGKKISKSLGNVVTSQKWLEFGTPKSILLLLYKRITGARELGFEDIPSLMDEYDELEKIYFGKIKIDNEAKLVKSKGLYEYVNLLNPPTQIQPYVSYRLLLELCKIFKEDRINRVNKKLVDYNNVIATHSAKTNEKAIVLSGDLTTSCEIDEFRNAYPERFLSLGLMEQNMMSFAAGLAREGLIPMVHTFSVFMYRRALDQIEMSIAYPNLPVKIFGFLPGVTTPGGASHQALNDIAVMRSLPNMSVIETGDATDVESVLELSLIHI